jgi:GT2 family glycosyltransferase
MDLFVYDKVSGDNHIESAPFAVGCDGPHGLVEGRNLATKYMLDNTDAEWLFWIDTDMGFQPDSLSRLLAAADSEDRPVVGGLCFALKRVRPDGYAGFVQQPVPTLFRVARDIHGEIGFASRLLYPEDTMVKVAATGSAFILIHRSVLELIRGLFGDKWYDTVAYEGGRPLSEDLSFCYRVGQVGKPIHVHTGIKTTHHKEIWLGDSQYQMPNEEPLLKRVKQDD